MEGVLVSAQKAGSPITVTVVSDEHGRFRFPRRPAFTRTLRPAHPRRGLRSGGPASRRDRHRAGGRRDQAAADRRSRRATHQYRMAHEHARHAATEAAADRVHELSHAGTDRSLDLQRRGVRSRPRAHGAVRQQHHAGARADARRQARGARRSGAQARRLSCHGESQQRADLAIRTADACRGPKAAPPTWSSPNTICRARPLRRTTCAPMRTATSGIRISSKISWASSIRAPARTGNTRYPCSSRIFPTGTLDLEPDADGNLWLAMMFQTGLAKFDMKSKTFQLFPDPAGPRQ